MSEIRVYGFEMARIAEVYLTTLSSIMKPMGLERNFTAFLLVCKHSGKITQNELAELLHKDKVSTMRAVDYLCDKNFLVRKPNKSDKRCHILEVTDKAKKLLPKVEEAIEKTNEILLIDFSAKDKKAFSKEMKSLMQTIDKMPQPEFTIKAVKRKK